MKAAVLKIIQYPVYPNAADFRYYLNKAVIGILTLATAIGAVTALIFLFTL
jgi:hypothetical protein